MCFFLLTCLLQKRSGTASILVLKSMPNSLMCTEPGLLDPKLSSLGSSEKGDSDEKRVCPPQGSTTTTHSRKRKRRKLLTKPRTTTTKAQTNKQYEKVKYSKHDNGYQFVQESFSKDHSKISTLPD